MNSKETHALILWHNSSDMDVIPLKCLPINQRLVGEKIKMNTNQAKVIAIGDEQELHQKAQSMSGMNAIDNIKNNIVISKNTPLINNKNKRKRNIRDMNNDLKKSNKARMEQIISNDEPIYKKTQILSNHTISPIIASMLPKNNRDSSISTSIESNIGPSRDISMSCFHDSNSYALTTACTPSTVNTHLHFANSQNKFVNPSLFSITPSSVPYKPMDTQVLQLSNSMKAALPDSLYSVQAKNNPSCSYKVEYNDSDNQTALNEHNSSSLNIITNMDGEDNVETVDDEFSTCSEFEDDAGTEVNAIGPIITTQVTKRDVIFMKNLYLQVKRQYSLQEKRINDMAKPIQLDPDFFQPGEGKIEIFNGCGFYLDQKLYGLIELGNPPEVHWQRFVKQVLVDVYGDELKYYSARGMSGKPRIAPQLLKGLLQRINKDRTGDNLVKSPDMIKHVNRCTINKLSYQNKKKMKEAAKDK